MAIYDYGTCFIARDVGRNSEMRNRDRDGQWVRQPGRKTANQLIDAQVVSL